MVKGAQVITLYPFLSSGVEASRRYKYASSSHHTGPTATRENGGGVSLPQILSGASSSNKMGWLKKISRDFRHRPRISFSVSCTFLPGREPCTGEKKNACLHPQLHTRPNATPAPISLPTHHSNHILFLLAPGPHRSATPFERSS